MIFPTLLKQFKTSATYLLRSAEVLTPTAQTTTDDYADVTNGTIDTIDKESVAMVMKNTHGANAIKWKVLASIDGTTYVEVQAEATLTFGTTGTFTSSLALYRYYKAQVKSSVGATAGTATLHVIAK